MKLKYGRGVGVRDSRPELAAEPLPTSHPAPEPTPETIPRPHGAWGIEVEILLACARTRLDENQVQRIRMLLRDGPNWERLFRLASFHRLMPLLYWHLNAAASDLVSDEMLNVLRTWFIREATQALRQTADLLEVLRLLGDGDVFAVPYKGPALAALIYNNLALRRSCDLDILVGRRDVPRARQLLEGAGFRPPYPASRAGREFLLRNRCSEIFVRESGCVVELHWAFTDGHLAFPLELEQLRPRLQMRSLGGSQVPTFAAEDLLLVLCVHGAKHCWDRLEWLCGVSELTRNEKIAWPEAIGRATELRVEKMLFLGLLLAHDLLEAPVPAQLLETARSRREVIQLARNVQQRLATAEDPETVEQDLFRIRLQPTSRDRLRYLFHRLTTPGREDTRLMLPLGRRSVPLPALVRPFRVAGKLIGGLIKRPATHGQPRQRRRT